MASANHAVFDKYAKFGKSEAQLKQMKEIRLEQKSIQKMMKDCGIVDSKYASQALDNDMSRVIGKLYTSHASKYPKGVKTFEQEGFDHLLRQIAESKKTTYEAIVDQVNKAEPSLSNVTHTAANESVGRMTDTSKYTGSHKERFDESGKGKGIEGRADRDDNTGYVGNYKGGGTYDKTH